MLKQFSKTIAAHGSSIQVYSEFYDLLTAGPLENANNKIRILHKMAYGFRDAKFLNPPLKESVLQNSLNHGSGLVYKQALQIYVRFFPKEVSQSKQHKAQ